MSSAKILSGPTGFPKGSARRPLQIFSQDGGEGPEMSDEETLGFGMKNGTEARESTTSALKTPAKYLIHRSSSHPETMSGAHLLF